MIADALGLTPQTIQGYGRSLGLKAHKRGRKALGNDRDSFVKFLMKGRTLKELHDKFNSKADAWLQEVFEGYNLFETRNRFQEVVYILLPAVTQAYEVQPHAFTFSIGEKKEGLQEPYMMVQLPDFKGKIIIAPLFDVHYGHKAHRHEKFLAYLRWIEETPNVYAICGGDLLENALDDGRGMTYDNTENPQTQMDDMTVLLSRIAHKILVAIPGNHEERTYKKAGINPMQVIAERLNIPFFDGPVFMSITGNTYLWNLYVQHGRGNSQTKGGKMNMAGRARKFTNNIHFFVSGHVHDALAEKETVIEPTPSQGCLSYLSQWSVVCQSFLSWADTYAYRAGYAPPSMGGVALELDDNGEYRATLN
jgi:hypothetical protein